MKTIIIDLDELKAKMIELGYTHTNLEPGTGVAEGWTNTLVDAIESLYSVETELLEKFYDQSDTCSVNEITLKLNQGSITIKGDSITSEGLTLNRESVKSETAYYEHNAAIKGILSSVLYLHLAGVNIETPEFIDGLNTSIKDLRDNY